VKIRLGRLKRIIKETVNGVYPGGPTRNILSPATSSREQIGSLADGDPIDCVDNPEGMPNHLFEPEVDPDDCFGPVPPDAEKPYLMQDPTVKDY